MIQKLLMQYCEFLYNHKNFNIIWVKKLSSHHLNKICSFVKSTQVDFHFWWFQLELKLCWSVYRSIFSLFSLSLTSTRSSLMTFIMRREMTRLWVMLYSKMTWTWFCMFKSSIIWSSFCFSFFLSLKTMSTSNLLISSKLIKSSFSRKMSADCLCWKCLSIRWEFHTCIVVLIFLKL